MVAATNGPPVLNGSAYIYPSKTLAQLRDDLLCMLGFADPLTDVDSETKTLLELRTLAFQMLGFADPLTDVDAETQTLLELRTSILKLLGFADPLTAVDSETKTLLQLRTIVYNMLGFADPLTDVDSETKTLLQLRTLVYDMLGFADPLTGIDAETKTLLQLRELVYRRLGQRYAAGTNPPGADEQIDKWISEAQQTVFRLAELDQAGVAFPADMVADGDSTEIDYVPILALATGEAKAQKGQEDSKVYFDELQKYLEDRKARRPPNVEEQIDAFINESQQSVFRMAELDMAGVAFPATMTADIDPTEIDYVPVLDHAVWLAKALYEQEDAKFYFAKVEKYLADRIARRPPDVADQIDAFINESQQSVFRMAELDKSGVAFPVTMALDADPTEIDYSPVLDHTVWLAKSLYKQEDANTYFAKVEKYLADRKSRRPPDIEDQLDAFINEAQQGIFRMVELDKAGVAYPAVMTLDADPTELDHVPILALATAEAKALYKQDDAKLYFTKLDKYLEDRKTRRPPDVEDQLNAFINESQQSIFRMVEFDKAGVAFPAVMTLDADPTELDYVPILDHAVWLAKALYKQVDAKLYFAKVEKYLEDRVMRRPPNVVNMANKWLERAQYHSYFRYALLRTERWWDIPITQGNRVYDVPSISSGPLTDVSFDATAKTISRVAGSWYTDGFTAGMRIKGYGATNAGNNDTQWTITSMTALVLTFTDVTGMVDEAAGAAITINTANYISLDFRKATEAWLVDDNRWLPLVPGIDPRLFNITQETIPSRWEMREFFEVFPTPNKAYTVWVKGHFGLMPFTADTDKTTIDPEVILLQAIVWGKGHFRQQDLMIHEKNLTDLIGSLNAGTYAGMRFIPNPGPEVTALPYPQTTFPRS